MVFGTTFVILPSLVLFWGLKRLYGLAIFFTVEMLWKVYGWSVYLHILAHAVFIVLQEEKGPESASEGSSSLGG